MCVGSRCELIWTVASKGLTVATALRKCGEWSKTELEPRRNVLEVRCATGTYTIAFWLARCGTGSATASLNLTSASDGLATGTAGLAVVALPSR